MKGYEYDCMIINITNMHFKIFCKLISLTLGRVGSPKRDSIVFEPRKQSFEHLICKYSKR